MAKFGPLRNQRNYISLERFRLELSKDILFIELEPLFQKLWALMSNFDSFYHDDSPTLSCHMTQVANLEKF